MAPTATPASKRLISGEKSKMPLRRFIASRLFLTAGILGGAARPLMPPLYGRAGTTLPGAPDILSRPLTPRPIGIVRSRARRFLRGFLRVRYA